MPTFKGYQGFPASICASPNDMIVHGIPGPYVLKDGDVITLDVGVTYRGWVADSALTVPIGTVSEQGLRLLETCRESLFDAAAACVEGGHLRISARPCRRGSRAPASAWCGRWWGTGSAGGCTRIRRSRTTGSPGAGPS